MCVITQCIKYNYESVKPESEGGIGISSQGFESADVRRVFIRKVFLKILKGTQFLAI